MNAWDPPQPTDGDWNAFQTYILPNSAVRGVVINVPWIDIETSQGHYDFSNLDNNIIPSYAGKEINLAFQPITYTNMNNPPGGVNTLTPPYVFTTTWASSPQVQSPPQDVVYCPPYPGSKGFTGPFANALTPNFDPTGFPVVYEKPFRVAYQNFVSAVLQHYKGASIGYMRFGISVGNEADATCTDELALLPAPNTFVVPTTWENWVSTMDSFEKSAVPSVQLMQSLNSLEGDPTVLPPFEAMTAANNGFGFGNNGLRKSDIANSASGAPCSGDWCALFDQYAGQVPLEVQEAQPSNPSGSDPTNVTGNLADLIPVAVQHHATILEVLKQDLFLAFDPHYQPANPQDSAFAGAYSTALTNCSQ